MCQSTAGIVAIGAAAGANLEDPAAIPTTIPYYRYMYAWMHNIMSDPCLWPQEYLFSFFGPESRNPQNVDGLNQLILYQTLPDDLLSETCISVFP